MTDLPPALGHTAAIAARLAAGSPAIFLDYDGTLAPIVADPDRAVLPVETRVSVERLAARFPVAVVSGRGVDDVRARVGLDGVWYAGSHGFELLWPDGWREERGREYLPTLDVAERALRASVRSLPGVRVERKPFSVAVHHRSAPVDVVQDIEAVARTVIEACPDLRIMPGRRVLDLQPDIPWDKGAATIRLLDVMVQDPGLAVPLYVGDDLTDEGAFRATRRRGIGILVGRPMGRATAARYRLEDPDEVRTLIDVVSALPAPAREDRAAMGSS
jgi:trehalose-phosphatase